MLDVSPAWFSFVLCFIRPAAHTYVSCFLQCLSPAPLFMGCFYIRYPWKIHLYLKVRTISFVHNTYYMLPFKFANSYDIWQIANMTIKIPKWQCWLLMPRHRLHKLVPISPHSMPRAVFNYVCVRCKSLNICDISSWQQNEIVHGFNQGPLLLTWFNFNPMINNWLRQLWTMGRNYLSIPQP